MKVLTVVGVRVELPSNQPIVLLKEEEGEKYLPIWIGPAEATAIALVADPPEQAPTRPLTHDLMCTLLERFNVGVQGVEILELRDNVFYADLLLEQDGKTSRISVRPSDGIALAIRLSAPISCAEEVLDAAGITLPETETGNDPEAEVAKFREFLETISPEDFAS